MKVEEVLQVLKENKSKHLYAIHVPSLKRKILFKPVTVGQQLTLSKFSIEDSNTFYKGMIALIQELSTELIDLTQITELDKVVILAKIKKANTIKANVFTITCPYCAKKFNHSLDLDNYVKEFENAVIEDSLINVNIFDINYEVKIGIPSIASILKVKESEEETNQLNSANNLVVFIKEISINNFKVDDFNTMSLSEKLSIYNELPSEILIEMATLIKDKYEFIFKNFMVYKLTCINCEKELQDTIDVDSFFLS
jgi:uncharacterized CHY-type Zn-finger protein